MGALVFDGDGNACRRDERLGTVELILTTSVLDALSKRGDLPAGRG
jgi:hypothetical protein